jgi:hypothetical protein
LVGSALGANVTIHVVGQTLLASTTEWTIPVTRDPAEGSSITLLKNWERLHCIASLKFVVSNFCMEA